MSQSLITSDQVFASVLIVRQAASLLHMDNHNFFHSSLQPLLPKPDTNKNTSK